MRADISQVLIERERWNSRVGKKSRRRMRRVMRHKLRTDGAEALSNKEPLLPRRERDWMSKYPEKEFTDNLRPLGRFLLKNVGRPWSKVYSEVCENLNTNSTVHQHVLDHLKQMVTVDVVMVDGKPYSKPRYRHGLEPMTSSAKDSFWSLYVNPDTGLLCQAPVPKPKPEVKRPKGWRNPDSTILPTEKKEATQSRLFHSYRGQFGENGVDRFVKKRIVQEIRVLEGEGVFVKRNGVWYSVVMAKLSAGGAGWAEPTVKTILDPLTKKPVKTVTEYGPRDLFFGPVGGVYRGQVDAIRKFYNGDLTHYATSKTIQISSKEIKRLGLNG